MSPSEICSKPRSRSDGRAVIRDSINADAFGGHLTHAWHRRTIGDGQPTQSSRLGGEVLRRNTGSSLTPNLAMLPIGYHRDPL